MAEQTATGKLTANEVFNKLKQLSDNTVDGLVSLNVLVKRLVSEFASELENMPAEDQKKFVEERLNQAAQQNLCHLNSGEFWKVGEKVQKPEVEANLPKRLKKRAKKTPKRFSSRKSKSNVEPNVASDEQDRSDSAKSVSAASQMSSSEPGDRSSSDVQDKLLKENSLKGERRIQKRRSQSRPTPYTRDELLMMLGQLDEWEAKNGTFTAEFDADVDIVVKKPKRLRRTKRSKSRVGMRRTKTAKRFSSLKGRARKVSTKSIGLRTRALTDEGRSESTNEAESYGDGQESFSGSEIKKKASKWVKRSSKKSKRSSKNSKRSAKSLNKQPAQRSKRVARKKGTQSSENVVQQEPQPPQPPQKPDEEPNKPTE